MRTQIICILCSLMCTVSVSCGPGVQTDEVFEERIHGLLQQGAVDSALVQVTEYLRQQPNVLNIRELKTKLYLRKRMPFDAAVEYNSFYNLTKSDNMSLLQDLCYQTLTQGFLESTRSQQSQVLPMLRTLAPDTTIQTFLKTLLDSADETMQYGAANALAMFNDPAAKPILYQAIESTNWLIRSRAYRFLCEYGDPEDLPLLVQSLQKGKHDTRRRIVEGLPLYQFEQVVDHYQAALADKDSGVRRRAVIQLVESNEPHAYQMLQKSLADPELKRNIISALMRMPSSMTWRYFQGLLNDEDPLYKRLAIQVIGLSGEKELLQQLKQVQPGEDTSLQHHLLLARLRLGDAAILNEIRSVLPELSPRLFGELLGILRNTGQTDLNDDLAERYRQSDDPLLRIPLAVTLWSLGDRSYETYIEEQIMQSENMQIKNITLSQVANAPGAGSNDLLLQMLDDPNEEFVREVMTILVQRNESRILQYFMGQLTPDNPYGNRDPVSGIIAMAREGNAEAQKLLPKLLTAGGIEIQKPVLLVIAHLKRTQDIQHVKQLLIDNDSRIRTAAAYTLLVLFQSLES